MSKKYRIMYKKPRDVFLKEATHVKPYTNRMDACAEVERLNEHQSQFQWFIREEE